MPQRRLAGLLGQRPIGQVLSQCVEHRRGLGSPVAPEELQHGLRVMAGKELLAQHVRVVDELGQDVDHHRRGDEGPDGVGVGQAALEQPDGGVPGGGGVEQLAHVWFGHSGVEHAQ